MVNAIPTLREVGYLFIDGANLASTITSLSDRYFDASEPPLIWDRIRNTHRKAFYYDAIPVQRSDEDANAYEQRVAAKRAQIAHIERQASYHVRTGEVRRAGARRGNEQKMVDVQLAVDALLMASRGLFASATFIVGDLDFAPLISALVEMGIDVSVLYPANQTTSDLLARADYASAMNIALVRDWIDPKFLQDHNLPDASFIFSGQADRQDQEIHTWMDDAFGACRLSANSDGLFQLLTSKSPNSTNHILQMHSYDGTSLRNYADDVFDLIIP